MTTTETALRPGVPTWDEYNANLKTNLFRRLESFSDDFLQRNAEGIQAYGGKWYPDPLHHWARQWEYPFVFQRLKDQQKVKILDAGSGVTFFPFYLTQELNASVVCLDRDAEFADMLGGASEKMESNVEFLRGPIQEIPAEDNSFDCGYCISVLEHTNDYANCVKELRRVIKPGGIFVVTFDLALRQGDGVDQQEARQLMNDLQSQFGSSCELPADALDEELQRSSIIDSRQFAKINPQMLGTPDPLRRAFKTLLRGRWPQRWWYKKITIICSAYS